MLKKKVQFNDNKNEEKIIDDYKQEYISKSYIEKYYPNVANKI